MHEVDFGYVGWAGGTIYTICFQKLINARNRPKEELSKLVVEIERVFAFLVEQGRKYGFNVDTILEVPGASGNTCFLIASQYSEKISKDIIERDIKVNNVDLYMQVPDFQYSDLTIKMLEKGINPYVVSYGKNSIDSSPSSFENEKAKSLLAKFPRSIHYSIEDINCEEFCPSDCPSKLKGFYYKNGPLVEMTDENRIGSGGFGMVFRQEFHGKPMAMKCTYLGEIEKQRIVNDTVSDMEANISELRIQSATTGPGIISPVAFVRQQDQYPDDNGDWIAENYNIYIYPLYDCNLYELHESHYSEFTEKKLNDILHQCLTRIGSNKRVMAQWVHF